MDEFEQEERRKAFNLWFAAKMARLGVTRLPPNVQGAVHDLMRRAYNAGTNYERRKNEPERLGGNN